MTFSELDQSIIGSTVKIKRLKYTTAGLSKEILEDYMKNEKEFRVYDIDKNWEKSNTVCIMDPKKHTSYWVSHKDLEIISKNEGE